MEKISVLSPIGINRVESRAISGRIGNLDGAKVGLLNNNKPNSEFLQDHMVKLLGERFRIEAVVKKVKPGPSVPAEELDQFAKEVGAVITAIGD